MTLHDSPPLPGLVPPMFTRRAFVSLCLLVVAWALGIGAMRALGAALPGDEIAYSLSDRKREGAAPDIWRLDLAHAVALNFTRHPAFDFAPVWSPDGRRLLFLSDRDGGSRLYVTPVDGSGEVLALTPRAGSYGGFRFSTDGEQIVFISIQGAAQTLYRVSADGSALTMLTDQTREVSGMLMEIGMDVESLSSAYHFAPLSLRFDAARAGGAGSWGIYIAPSQVDAQAPLAWRRLASTGHVYTESPVWSPDGARIAYLSDADGDFDIYTVEPTSGIVHRWTYTDAVESALRWRPRGGA